MTGTAGVTGARVGSALATGLVVGALTVAVARLAPADGAVAALAAAVLVLAARSLPAGEEHRWPAVPHAEADGARSTVAVLVWGFAGRDGKVSDGALRRLRRQAGRRLAREGIVLEDGAGHLVASPGGPRPGDDSRARELLGDRAWRVLTDRGDLPHVRDVAHCIDVVERLAPADPEGRP